MFSLITVLRHEDRKSLEKLLLDSTSDVDAEKILVDDLGKIEGIKKLAEQYGWQYISNERPSGLAASLNKGISLASHEHIITIDPVSYCPKGSLESLNEGLNKEGVGVIGPRLNDPNSWTDQYDKDAPKLEDFEKDKNIFEDYSKKIRSTHGKIRTETRVTGSVLGLNKKIWKKVGKFDETLKDGFFEDTDFISKVMKLGYKSIFQEDNFVHHGGYKGTSRTIYQESLVGPKMLINAVYNATVHGHRHGYLHTLKHLYEGIKSSTKDIIQSVMK